MTLTNIEQLLKEIKFRDWMFRLKLDQGRPYLQLEWIAPDNHKENSPPEIQRSRKWWLSFHMCENEIIRTAYKAVKTAIEHETDEQFTFLGKCIFNPHIDYRKLAAQIDDIGLNIRE